ncbi:5-oxoprolinase subunit PxpB [Salinithrix halophila]|uniref:5-oxoprolinase subunit PxpB n=1 Tax=Salinithrix halophila TaxID=1485204 RepID=A0ABV8JC05_9BACL
MSLHFQPLGDTGVRVQFGDRIDPAINNQIRRYCRRLKKLSLEGVVEWVPSYTAVTVYYQPYRVRYGELVRILSELVEEIESDQELESRLVEIPVVYGGRFGPDLEEVARYSGLTPEEVIRIHSQSPYRIYMMGFVPGFPYLGGMSETIAVPRLEKPREKIPAGSVGIAGAQTGVYPLETPGGWRLIGRTPLRLYDPHRHPPMLLAAGDHVQFRPISEEEYSSIEEEVARGKNPVKEKTWESRTDETTD